jgi:hypothetical protein
MTSDNPAAIAYNMKISSIIKKGPPRKRWIDQGDTN